MGFVKHFGAMGTLFLLTTFCASAQDFVQSYNFPNVKTSGPNPKIDITTFGARAMFSSAFPATTITCTASSNQVIAGTVTNPFFVGDYITADGCGPAVQAATPAAPTVTSGASAMQTVFDATIKPYTGSNTDSYILVTRDNNGGLTLPSTATTITNAVPLGEQTATVSSVTSLGTTMTITLGSAGPPNGTLFHLSYIAQGGAQPNHKFDGYYNVCGGGGTTSITVCNMPFWSNTTDSTAAEIIWFNGNQLSWTQQSGAYQQYICGKRPGDSGYHFLGASVPVSNTYGGATVWTDWGTTLTPSSPTGFPFGHDSICTAASANNDYLTAKITACTASCGTGSTWTLSGYATNNGSGVNVTQDSAPALAAAMSFANQGFTRAAVYIPCQPASGSPGALFFFTSPVYLNSSTSWVEQCGTVNVGETIDLNANPSVSWMGAAPSEAGSSPVTMFCAAYPCLNDANLVRNMTFDADGNDGSLAVVQNAGSGNSTMAMDHNRFIATGYSSMGVLSLSSFPNGYMTNTRLDVGPGSSPSLFDTTWTPWLYIETANNGTSIRIDRDYGAGRGIYANQTTSGSLQLDIGNHYIQGALMPMFGAYSASGTGGVILDAHRWTDDTSPQAMISLQTNPASPVANFIIRSRDLAGNPVNVLTGWQATQWYEENDPGNSTFFPYLTSVFPDNTNFGKMAINTATAADSFNRSNGALTSPWFQELDSVNISSNQITASGGGTYGIAYYLAAFPNTFLNPTAGGEFCDVTVANYNGGFGGCILFTSGPFQSVQANVPGFACIINGSTITIATMSGATVATQSYSGANGDHIYFVGVPSTTNTSLACTVFSTTGRSATASGTGGTVPTYSYPGVVLSISGPFTEDNFSGGTINPTVVTTTENTYTAPQHFLSATVGNTAPIAGTLPGGALYAQSIGPTNLSTFNTLSVATNTNISATNMVATTSALHSYLFTWTVSLTAVGVGCSGSTTVTLNAIFTDPNASSSTTESLATITLANSGNGTVGFVANGTDSILAKSGTAVQYSTSSYKAGRGCTTNPTYQVSPTLVQLW